MGNVKISAFSNQPDLSLIEGLAGYEGSVGSYTNARISGSQLETYLQNNLSFATASGTNNYVAKFTGTNSLGDSQIQDDGTTVGVGGAPNTNAGKLFVQNATASSKWSVASYDSVGAASGGAQFWVAVNTSLGSGATRIGVEGKVQGTGIDNKVGVVGLTSGTGAKNIGLVGEASGATANYAIKLSDGTQGVGKFLKSITVSGEANWADLPATVGTLTINSTIGTSSSVPLTITDDGADNYTLNPFVYAGTTNVGFVPTGGTAQKLLAGDGSWQSPTFTAKQFPFSGVDADPILSVNVGETGSPAVPVTTGQIRLVGGTNANVTRTNDNTITITADGGGTVSSVGLTMPAAFAVAGSPVTSSGTLAVTTTGGGANEYLKSDGTWDTPAGTYTLPLAANGTRGGIQIGFLESGKNYPVELASEKAYVNVPWTDTDNNTTYAISSTQTSGTNSNPYLTLTGSNPSSTDNVQFIGEVVTVTRNDDDTITWSIPAFSGGANVGAVPTAASAAAGTFLKNDGTWATPSGSGTVTSVGLAMPPAFNVTNSPVTGSGILTVGVTGGVTGQFLAYNGQWADAVNAVSAITPGTSSGSPLLVTGPNSGQVNMKSMAFAGGGNVGHVPSAGEAAAGDFLKNDGTWAIPAGSGLASWIVDVDTGGDQTIDSAGNTLEIFGGTGITTGVGFTTEKNVTITLDNTAVTAGTYGDASNVAQITVDAQGRITNATDVAISASGGGGFPGSTDFSPSGGSIAGAIDTFYGISTTSGVPDRILVLPTAVGNTGKIVGVKYTSQNAVSDTLQIKTVSASNQTIDGIDRDTTGLQLPSVYTYYELISDGANWWIK